MTCCNSRPPWLQRPLYSWHNSACLEVLGTPHCNTTVHILPLTYGESFYPSATPKAFLLPLPSLACRLSLVICASRWKRVDHMPWQEQRTSHIYRTHFACKRCHVAGHALPRFTHAICKLGPVSYQLSETSTTMSDISVWQAATHLPLCHLLSFLDNRIADIGIEGQRGSRDLFHQLKRSKNMHSVHLLCV